MGDVTQTLPVDTAPNLQEQDRSLPRYARIKRVLEERIMDGSYPIGSLIPPEIELAQEFAASRSTIREALRYLTEQGYLERRQGVGTRVISDTTQRNFYVSLGSLEELFQVAAQTYFVALDLREVTLTAELAERVGGVEGERWFRLNGIRWTEVGGRPICYVQSFIPKRFEHVVQSLVSLQSAFFKELERHSESPIEEVEQEIKAVQFPAEIASQLGLRPGAISLQLLRRYVTADGVIIASFNWHPAEQMTYLMRIKSERTNVADDTA